MTRELTSLFVCYTPSNVLSMGWCPGPELCFELVYVQKKKVYLSVNTEVEQLPMLAEFSTAAPISELVAWPEDVMKRMNLTSYGPIIR